MFLRYLQISNTHQHAYCSACQLELGVLDNEKIQTPHPHMTTGKPDMTEVNALIEFCQVASTQPALPTLMGPDNNAGNMQRGGFAALCKELENLDGASGAAVADVATEMARWMLPNLPVGFGMMDGIFGNLKVNKAPHPIELWRQCLQHK